MEKPLLLPIVRSVGAPPDVQVMPYREIAKLVTRYILEKADTFFDPRNISVANIRGDPLSAALNVDSIHRTQIHHFTQNGIINQKKRKHTHKTSTPTQFNHQTPQTPTLTPKHYLTEYTNKK